MYIEECVVERMQIYLSGKEKKNLKRKSKKEGISMSEVVRRILDKYFITK
jgi:LDH2 family malate/lactate/ureidoglycolate dehydrogenase